MLQRRVSAVAWMLLLAAALFCAFVPRRASASEKDDAAAIAAVDKILSQDVAQANFGEAKKKLKTIIDRCAKKCSATAVAHAHVALGMIAVQIGQADDAKTAWFDALNADPNAQLPSSGVSQNVRAEWDKTQKAWIAANPQPDDSQKAGWVNKQAFELAKAAIAAEAAGTFVDCIEKDKQALTLEENLRARMHLAGCEAKAGKVVDALRDNAKALELARQKNDTSTVKQIQDRVTELVPRLAHVKFDLPSGGGVTDLKVSFDERAVPPERFAESFTIDPGPHSVHAEGFLRGARVSFDDKIDVKDGETKIVKVTLKPAALTQGQLQCMVTAKTQEEILACLPSDKKPLVVHVALDTSAYTDTLAVHVLTPAIRATVASPTAGWNVGAGYLIDVVSAASPDIVASASPAFHDVRNVANVNGGYKQDRIGIEGSANYSIEHDYTSRTVGGSLTSDFNDKQLTPQLGFYHSWDTIGRTGTDFDVFHNEFYTEEIDAGATIIMSPLSLLVVGATAGLEHGDQSKLYRYIPLFAPGVSVPIGADQSEVNALRLPAKPLEQLPLDRQRYSLAGRYIRRLDNASLRLEERLYFDSWGMKASTTELQYMIDVGRRLRVWPRLHLHVQTAASFYKRIYGATLNSDGSATIPQYRTDDRELSPMFGITPGGGIHYTVTDPASPIQLAPYATADLLFNDYLDSLYVRTRYGVYGTIGIEADFE